MTQHLLHVFLISHSNHIPQTVGRRILNNRKNSPSSWQGWKRCQSSQILHWINHFHFFSTAKFHLDWFFCSFLPKINQSRNFSFGAKIQIFVLMPKNKSYFLGAKFQIRILKSIKIFWPKITEFWEFEFSRLK